MDTASIVIWLTNNSIGELELDDIVEHVALNIANVQGIDVDDVDVPLYGMTNMVSFMVNFYGSEHKVYELIQNKLSLPAMISD